MCLRPTEEDPESLERRRKNKIGVESMAQPEGVPASQHKL